MKSDPDQFLNKLVVAALTTFVVVCLLLGAFVAREIWLQQRIVGLSTSLQTNLEELEQTTEVIQNKMQELEETADNAPAPQEWDNMNELLEDVDQQLSSIEETIDDVAVTSEATIDLTTDLTTVEEVAEDGNVEKPTFIRAQADQIFTIFAILTGIAAIAIAILLGLAMRVQDNRTVV